MRHSFYTAEVLEKVSEFKTPSVLRWLRYTVWPLFYLASQLAQMPIFISAVELVGPAAEQVLARINGSFVSLMPPRAPQVVLGLYVLYAAWCSYQVAALSYRWQRKLMSKAVKKQV